MTNLSSRDLITNLQNENRRLHAELLLARQQLQKAQSHRVVVCQGAEPDEKFINDWTLQDLISYFKKKFYEHTADDSGHGREYRFSRKAYSAAIAQLGQFAKYERLTNGQLKDLIDFHFQHTFDQRMDPSIPFICSAAGMNRYNNYQALQASGKKGGEFVGDRYAHRPRPDVQQSQPPRGTPEEIQAVDDALDRLAAKRPRNVRRP